MSFLCAGRPLIECGLYVAHDGAYMVDCPFTFHRVKWNGKIHAFLNPNLVVVS